MNKIVKLIMAGVFATFSASASALLLEGAEVGVEDTLVDWADLSNSGSTAEAGFFAAYMGVDVSTLAINQLDGSGSELGSDSEATNWVAIDDGDYDTDLWGYYLNDLNPDLFLIKTGENTGLDDGIDCVFAEGCDITIGDTNLDKYSHFLYTNNVELGYAIIDLFDYNFTNGNNDIRNIDIFRISHVSVPYGDVPEPGVIGLLAIGLLGIAVARRRMKV